LQAGGRRFDPVWLHQHPSPFAEIRAHLSVRNRARRFDAPRRFRARFFESAIVSLLERVLPKNQVLHELVSSRCIFYIVKRGLTWGFL
jgi:hypothetical protein